VLFPEGGGQPNDVGKIDGVEVIDVQRVNHVAVHYVKGSIPPGKEVSVSVDWEHRFDHMQHHSGQHLLSAVVIREYGYNTVSWNLGVEICHVELETEKLTQEQIDNIERKVNIEIRTSHAVVVKEVKPEDLKSNQGQEENDEKQITVSVDASVEKGPIRLVEIEGVDKCTCCGTHVSNTSELQVIKIFHTEKMRGNTRLFFVVGNRVLKMLKRMFENERALTSMLNSGPSDHLELVDRLQKQSTNLRKVIKADAEELCQFIGEKLHIANQESKTVFYHREEGDLDFLATLHKVLLEKSSTNSEKLIFLSGGNSSKKANAVTGSNPGEGQFLLLGKQEDIEKVSQKILQLLGAKGGGKKGRFQAKANALSEAALKEVELYLKS